MEHNPFGDGGCSTPFGITDGITGLESLTAISSKCAQRLSASLTESLDLDVAVAAIEPCSTPFGITDGITGIAAATP